MEIEKKVTLIDIFVKDYLSFNQKVIELSHGFNCRSLNKHTVDDLINEIKVAKFWSIFLCFVLEWIFLQDMFCKNKQYDGRNEYSAQLAAHLLDGETKYRLMACQRALSLCENQELYTNADDERFPAETAIALARALMIEHRTIQQNITSFCLYVLEAFRKNDDIHIKTLVPMLQDFPVEEELRHILESAVKRIKETPFVWESEFSRGTLRESTLGDDWYTAPYI